MRFPVCTSPTVDLFSELALQITLPTTTKGADYIMQVDEDFSLDEVCLNHSFKNNL